MSNRNKAHNQCNAFELSRNHHPHSPWKNGLLATDFWSCNAWGHCFLLQSKVNRLCKNTYSLLIRFPSHLGHHRALSRVPYAIQYSHQSSISYIVSAVSICQTQSPNSLCVFFSIVSSICLCNGQPDQQIKYLQEGSIGLLPSQFQEMTIILIPLPINSAYS